MACPHCLSTSVSKRKYRTSFDLNDSNCLDRTEDQNVSRCFQNHLFSVHRNFIVS